MSNRLRAQASTLQSFAELQKITNRSRWAGDISWWTLTELNFRHRFCPVDGMRIVHVRDGSEGTTRHALSGTEHVAIGDLDGNRSAYVVLGQEVARARRTGDRSPVTEPLVHERT